jgi:DUF1009 family protein
MDAVGNDTTAPLAVVCCAGALPFAVADAVVARGRHVVLFPVEGIADAAAVARYPHHWMKFGQAGRLFSLMRQEGCREVVLIGNLTRPKLSGIRLDFTTLRLFPAIIAAYRGGDDHLLTSVGRVFEREGFTLRGAHEVAPEILIPAGTLTRRQPTADERSDIDRGLALIKAIGAFDVGQAVVVFNSHIIAVEGIEGTDEMLARVADLRRRERLNAPAGRGVIVKAPKPQQDRRIDLPAIGTKTVENVTMAGLAGIAVAAGETIIADLDATVAAADRAGIFIAGVKSQPA